MRRTVLLNSFHHFQHQHLRSMIWFDTTQPMVDGLSACRKSAIKTWLNERGFNQHMRSLQLL